MNYLTNYYRNLSEQLQERVNILEKQLNEYLVRPGEKDGKKGTFYGDRFVADEDRIEYNPNPIDKNNRIGKKIFNKSAFKVKRTPEQQKAIDEWEAKYGIRSPNFGKPPPPGFKTPPRPFDPEREEEPPIPYIKNIAPKDPTPQPKLEPKREPKLIPEPKEKDFVPRYPTLQPNINPKPIPEPKEKEFVPVPVPDRSFPGEKRPTLPGEKPSEFENLAKNIKLPNVDSEPSEKIKIQQPKDELIGKKKKPAFEPENRPYIT